MSAHMSRDRLYYLLKKQYYWRGMFRLLQSILTTRSFEIVAMDKMGPLTTSPDGFKYLLNVVEIFTSWPEAIPLRTLTAEETARAVQTFISRHACPKRYNPTKAHRLPPLIRQCMQKIQDRASEVFSVSPSNHW